MLLAEGTMYQELFFEIQRKKIHLLVQARENWTAKDVKKLIEGILKIPVEKQSLRRSINEQWLQIDDKQTLQEQGFSPKNARADEPAVLALVIPEDNDKPDICPLSVAPPVPEAMQKQREVDMEAE